MPHLVHHLELHFEQVTGEMERAQNGNSARAGPSADRLRLALRSLRSASSERDLDSGGVLRVVDRAAGSGLDPLEREVLTAWVEGFFREIAPDTATVEVALPQGTAELASETTRRRLAGNDLAGLLAVVGRHVREACGAEVALTLLQVPGGRIMVQSVSALETGPDPAYLAGLNWEPLRSTLDEGGSLEGEGVMHRLPRFFRDRWAWAAVAPLSIPGERPEVVGALVAIAPRRPARREPLGQLVEIASRAGMALGAAELLADVVEAATAQERARLARELHDGLANDLAAIVSQIKLHEQTSLKRRDPQEVLAHVRGLSEAALATARGVLAELRGRRIEARPVEIGLNDELHHLARDLNLHLELEIQGELGRMRPEERETVLQVAREALANVHRHSGTEAATVRGDLDAHPFWLEVVDGGQGFDLGSRLNRAVERGRFGITGMRERAELLGGRLEITSRSGWGTTVRLTGPGESRKRRSV
ncbi:MAG: sensor histidine kinase [Candidatus Dormibacteria bacterium]